VLDAPDRGCCPALCVWSRCGSLGECIVGWHPLFLWVKKSVLDNIGQIVLPAKLGNFRLKKRGMKTNNFQILVGVAALLLGSLVYLIDRPPDQTYFIYSSNITMSLYKTFPNLFGAIGNSLPAFIHVFSFCLITAGLFSCSKRACVIVCLSWLFVDFAFELGQKYSALPLKIIPGWFDGIPFLENSADYFRCGTFDMLDLAAITLGGVTACLLLTITNKRKEKAR